MNNCAIIDKVLVASPPMYKKIFQIWLSRNGERQNKDSVEDLDRSQKENFIAYMLTNPVYFETIFKITHDQESIETAYDVIQQLSSNIAENC